MQRGRLDRHRANRVVGTVVAASFVDRQHLDELETRVSDPVYKLAQRRDIADSQVVISAQAKEGRQYGSDLFFGRKPHWKIPQPLSTCQSSTSSFGISFKNREGRWKMSP